MDGWTIWQDGHGRAWRVEATPQAVTLQSGEDVVSLDRSVWETDLQLAALGPKFILRFYGQNLEVGFLLSSEQVREFLLRTGLALPAEPADIVTAAPVEPGVPTDGLMWPQMTHSAAWALICSALAFVPLLGLLFALAAVVLVLVFRSRAPKTAALAHARTLCRVATLFVTGGAAISLLATYSFLRTAAPNLDTLSERMFAADMAYTHGTTAAAILVVILSLSIHECGHALVAWWCGDDYARSLGRVTLNPIAHIDWFGTVILPLLLTLAKAPVFGYAKPVPVRLGGIRRYRRAHILISLAGPGANLLLGTLALALYLALGCLLALFVPGAEISGFSSVSPQVSISGIPGATFLAAAAVVLKLAWLINVALAGFNLVPIPPLDGSWVLQHLFPGTVGRLYVFIRPFGFAIFLVLLWTRAFDYLLIPILVPVVCGFALVAACTGL